jgi:hypothetical protein
MGVSPLMCFNSIEEPSFDYIQNAEASKDKDANDHEVDEG